MAGDYEKGDGFGEFFLDLITPDTDNVAIRQSNRTTRAANRQETIRGLVAETGSTVRNAQQGVVDIVGAIAPALPSIAGAAAPFVGGVGGAILGSLSGLGSATSGAAATAPPLPSARKRKDSNTGLYVLGAIAVAAVAFSRGKKGEK